MAPCYVIPLFSNFGKRSRLGTSLFFEPWTLCVIETHPGYVFEVSSRQPHFHSKPPEQKPPTSPGPCILGLAWVIVAASITHPVGLQVTNTIKDHPLPKTELVLLFFHSPFCHREYRLPHPKLSSSLLTPTATVILNSSIPNKNIHSTEIFHENY